MELVLAASDGPVYIDKQPNLHDYTLFANGGWDGNWFVGYNSAWVKKLPAIPAGSYTRAYIGVKLGRMKTLPGLPGSKAWERRAVPGKIFAAIASTASWNANAGVLVTTTDNIPFEGETTEAIEGIGESRWFWAPIPITSVSPAGDNYIAVWSNTPELLTVSSSPVLAAAWGGKDQGTWLVKDLAGLPPPNAKIAMQTPINYFQPAIALKLIPQGPSHPVNVRVVDWKQGTPDHLKPTIIADVLGDRIEKVWVEYGKDKTWTPVGRPIYQPPYHLTLEQGLLPKGKTQLRVVASNSWEERGESQPFSIEVSPVTNAKK